MGYKLVIARIGLFIVLIGLWACATAEVPLAPISAQIAAKRFRWPPVHRVNIYVYRNQSSASGDDLDLYVDGVRIGSLGFKTFVVVAVCAGRHVLATKAPAAARSEQGLRDLFGSDDELSMQVQAGWNYFVKLSVAWRLATGGLVGAIVPRKASWEMMDAADGKSDVMECQLIAESPALMPPRCAVETVEAL